MEEGGNTFKSCVTSQSRKGGQNINLEHQTVLLVANVASMWLQYREVFSFGTKSLVAELDIAHWFPDDLYCNGETKTGHRTPGMV